jgi:hypothetical protein
VKAGTYISISFHALDFQPTGGGDAAIKAFCSQVQADVWTIKERLGMQ